MRIAVCDYSGHPFQVQLSRELARRGHVVCHIHFAEFQTPKGHLEVDTDDPPGFSVEAVSIGCTFSKQSFIRRRFQEIEVGRRISSRIATFGPTLVLGSNLPLDALRIILGECKRQNRLFVFWQQDIYSVAVDKILSKMFGTAGHLIGLYYREMEKKALLRSDAVVVISEDFPKAIAEEFGISDKNLHVVENWAPLDEIAPRPRINSWSVKHQLEGREVVLYTGTLGMKHDPAQLLAVAKALSERPGATLVVTSEGPAADWLAAQALSENLPCLRVLPFQRYADYPDVLASADVLVCILEADAGIYSVPSKVLSYLCSERAVVVSAPEENLASRLIVKSGAGLATPAQDSKCLSDAILQLLNNPELRRQCGLAARQHAARAFAIGPIGETFENIFESVRRAKQESSNGTKAV